MTKKVDDRVTCRICSKRLHFINNLHLRVHQTNVVAYKKQFPGAPLSSKSHKQKQKKQIQKMWDETPEVYAERYIKSNSLESNLRRAKTMREYWTEENRKKKSDWMRSRWDSDYETMKELYKPSPIDYKRGAKKKLYELKTKLIEELPEITPDEVPYDYYIENHSYSKQGTRVYYIANPYKPKILMRSMYELWTAFILDDLGVVWDYEPFPVPYSWRGSTKYYYPDFYLPFMDHFIEVKPVFMQNDPVVQVKKRAVEELGATFDFFGEDIILGEERDPWVGRKYELAK